VLETVNKNTFSKTRLLKEVYQNKTDIYVCITSLRQFVAYALMTARRNVRTKFIHARKFRKDLERNEDVG